MWARIRGDSILQCLHLRQFNLLRHCVKMVFLTTAATRQMEGKVVLITGSSSGIGEAMALEYCRQGADVTINGRDDEKLQSVKRKCEKLISGNQKIASVVGDITKEEVRHQLLDDTVRCFGKLNILVKTMSLKKNKINNAGSSRVCPIEKNAGLTHLDDMLDVHVRAPYHLTKLCIPQLIKNKGVLINISSIAGLGPVPFGSIVEYSMAKCCLEQLTRWVAYELGPKGVRALNLNIALVATRLTVNSGICSESDVNAMFELGAKYQAVQRIAQPEEVAKVTAFLTSDDASFMTGSNILLDGGFKVMPAGPLTTTSGPLQSKE